MHEFILDPGTVANTKCLPIQIFYESRLVLIDTNELIIHTCQPPNSLTNQNQCVSFLVSCWLNLLLFQCSMVEDVSRYNRKTASIALSVFQRRQKKYARNCMMKAAIPIFL
jgi:hypothetical protein